ncbi:BMP family ABC transporter substrate-binding protein [Brevibacillus composti]|uniref:BMP family ABC transporter substrate-binding protein n=1 Tax=Brevibacillus composti TaxID=2796470 RepID=A0A7T5EP75_9BACL|nr:BMP family ABC transporter substrate-binding protein [Brevibacillus composti]QQE76193.1 BMP family ABC transporter substrate-binding protein [Brevibacillus composti]QUO43222.1 BMP family ABC transporter substrate-binding protein [Brevibacillus composti]
MKKVLSVLSVATLSLSLVLAGCGNKPEGQPQGAGEQGGAQGGAAPTARIGMVTDVGGVNDNSFNQSAWEGLQKLQKDLNLAEGSVDYLQSTSDADYIPNLTQFVKDNWDLTWGIGFVIGDHVKKVATENPDSKLAIIDAEVDAPNVESVLFKEHEGSFLVGVVAAKMTKSKKIGFVGGMEIPVIKRFELGFEAGVKAVDPSIEVITVYTGAFDKPDLGKSTASQMYDQGADIIFHASGATGDGVFNEAKARKSKGQDVWVIGVDKDQSLTFGDDITLTSMVKRVDEAVYRVSKDVIDGKFQGGKIVWLGLAENGVGLADTSSKNVPEDVLKLADEFKEKIVKGEITVPEK